MNFATLWSMVFILLLSFNSFEQVTYQKVYGDAGTSFNLFTDACATSSNEIVNVGCWTPSVTNTSLQPFVTKVDENGAVMWSKEFASPGIGYAQSISPVSDGGFLIAGRIDTLNTAGSDDDAFVLKVDENGGFLWMKIIGSSVIETFKRVYEAPNGEIVALGINRSTMNSNEHSWFVRMSSTGTVISSTIYFASPNSEAYTVLFHPDGGYVIGGIGTSNSNSDAFLFKISDNGSLQWFKSYGISGEAETIHDMVMLPDTSIVFVGTRTISDRDIFMGKTDSLGNLIWFQNYGGPEHDEAYRILKHSNGGFVVGGSTEGLDGAVGQMIFKTDTDGNVEWTRVIGDHYSNGTVGLVQLPNGALIHSGTLLPTQGSAVGTISQLNANGEGCDYSSVTLPSINQTVVEDSPTPYVSFGPSATASYDPSVADVVLLDSTNCTTLSVGEEITESQLKIYPNPVGSGAELWISSSNSANEPINIEVFDAMGRPVYSEKQSQNTFSVSTLGWSKGVYTVAIRIGEHQEIKRIVLN